MSDARVTRVTGDAREMMIEQFRAKYEAGASIRALSSQSGRSYGFVHRLLSEGGVELRGRGGNTRAR